MIKVLWAAALTPIIRQFWGYACVVSRDTYVGVKSYPAFSFHVLIFPIHCVTFIELSLKIKDVSY